MPNLFSMHTVTKTAVTKAACAVSGLSQLPDQFPSSNTGTASFRPAVTNHQFTDYITSQEVMTQHSPPHLNNRPSMLSQQLPSPLDTHPFFFTDMDACTASTMQSGLTSPSITHIFNSDLFPVWTPSSDQPDAAN